MKLIYVLILALSIFTLSACTTTDAEPIPTEDQIEMTLEELSLFDGREGRKAYIAVAGNIYDVSNSSLWPNGSHNGYQAGQDLTIPIMSSPHGLSTLKGVPLIGILVEKTEEVPLDDDNIIETVIDDNIIETVIDDVVVEESNPDEVLLNLTLEELAAFDGREGRKAYIAVSGNIYDVTNSSLWLEGNHNGYQAGQDLTDQILNQSPHGLSTLDGIPLIGTLVVVAEEEPLEEEVEPEDQLLRLTLQELAAFDGRDGRKGYIAVDGIIYDVTNSALWPDGNHNGYQAGQDLTIPIMSSPHGLSTLSRLPIVGILVSPKS